MASSLSPKFLIRRLLLSSSRPLPLRLFSPPLRSSSFLEASVLPDPGGHGGFLSPATASLPSKPCSFSRFFFSSRPSQIDKVQGPAAIDYRSLLREDEFHHLADATIHDLQEKLEEYGDSIEIDGYDIDYGNEVLTLKLGRLGTYVINKQTPNRQIWLSSPVSGPSRFDWDATAKTWVYRRTKASLLRLLEEELAQLCGKPINLS